MPEKLTLKVLQEAVAGRAAALRSIAKLQPAGGAGSKVFPPTYAGAVYATEKRRLPGHNEPVDCVLLDSVQSQANRMEESLQQAVDAGRLKLPVIEVDFSPFFPGEDQPDEMQLLDPVGKITSLQAPHRIADAILRDSIVKEDGKPFRTKNEQDESQYGQRIRRVSLQDATVLLELCPTALLFGVWDSTGPKGGLGAKFERSMVSEIIGINAVYGIRTSSRIDPLGIRSEIEVWDDGKGGWTLENTGKKYGRNKETQGKPSAANHSNIVPSFAKYQKGAEGRDPLRPASVELDYRVQTDDENLIGRNRFRSLEIEARQGAIAAGGVTIDRAEQTIVLSLPALRRLRFPVNGKMDRDVDNAAQTVLAALGLCAAALADEAGLDLRSRCLLYPEQDLTWTLLDRKSGGDFVLPADDAVALFEGAVAAAKQAGLPWREEPLVLQPSDELVKLVVKSQRLAIEQGGDSGEGGE